MAAPPFSVDLDRAVEDQLVLSTIPGAEDYLLADVGQVPGLLAGDLAARGLVTVAVAGPLRPLESLRLAGTVSVFLGRPDKLLSRIGRSLANGVLSALPRRPIRFRVGPMSERFERRDLLVTELDWRNDPSGWDVNLEEDAGLLRAEVGSLYRPRRVPHGHLRRLGNATNPVVAAVLVRMAEVGHGQVVLDPCCGIGTTLVEVLATHRSASVLGSDISPDAVAVATENLSPFDQERRSLMRVEIASLASKVTSPVDRVVADLPFGKRMGSHRSNATLYPAILRTIDRVMSERGRAVLLTEDKRLFERELGRTRGLMLVERRVLTTGGLHPTAYVVERRGQPRPVSARR